jgi:hypothetical protein
MCINYLYNARVVTLTWRIVIAKANKKEMLERETSIRALMSEGVSKTDICEQLAKQYKVSPRTIETQYYKIVGETAELLKKRKDEVALMLYEIKLSLLDEARKTRKTKTALDIAQSIGKMAGVYDSTQAENKTPDVIKIGVRDYSGELEVVKDGTDDAD